MVRSTQIRNWFWLSALVIFGLNSCEETSPAFQRGNAYTVTVPEGFLDEMHVFTTDESGNVFYQVYWQPGDPRHITVYAPKGYTGQVNLHYIARYEHSVQNWQYQLSSIIDVPAGVEITHQAYIPFTYYPDWHKILVKDVPIDQYKTIWGVGPKATPLNDFITNSEQIFASPILSGPLTYILMGDNDVTPRYFHLSDAGLNDTTTVNFSDFSSAEKVSINLSKSVTSASLRVYATFEESQPQFVYAGGVKNVSSFALYYYPSSVFSGFETDLELISDDVTYRYVRHGGRVSQLTFPDMRINSLSATGNALTADVSGVYDVLFMEGTSNWTIGERLHLFSSVIKCPGEIRTATFPDVIKVVRDHWPEFEKMSPVDFSRVALERSTSGGQVQERWRVSQYMSNSSILNP